MIDTETKEHALSKWGRFAQLDMGQEECAELIVAINKYKRNESQDNIRAIASEIADVELMTEQLRYIFRIDGSVDAYKLQKIDRLKERLAQ